MRTLRLIWDTGKYQRPRQILFRGLFALEDLVRKRPCRKGFSFSEIRRLPEYYQSIDGDEEDLTVAKGIEEGIFPFFGGRSIALKGDDWDLSGNSYRLACFKLNGFEWLTALCGAYKQTGDDKYIRRGKELIDSWISSSGESRKTDRWNPYVTANRIMNWIGFLSAYADEEELKRYGNHIAVALKELAGHIEYQLGANHLLSEGRALMYGGAFLGRLDIYEAGKRLLKKEYPEQFLPDGGHYERSVSYHVEALEQYFEAVYLMHLCCDPDELSFAAMIRKSYVFLHHMIEVNGKIPLLNDAAEDYPFDAADFLSTSAYLYETMSPKARPGRVAKRWGFCSRSLLPVSWQEKQCLSTGFYKDTFQVNGEDYDVVLDVGDNGPDENLGHAHADALSILLTGKAGRIIGDSGVFTYEKGEDRALCRKTGAHSTIEIDGKDSAEVWGAFRTARRGHTRLLKAEDTDVFTRVSALSDGYCHTLPSPVWHVRTYTRRKKDGTILITDRLRAKSSHSAVLRFILGPDVRLTQASKTSVWLGDTLLLTCSVPLRWEKVRIAERFGERKESWCLLASFPVLNDTRVSTKIQFRES